MTLSGCISHVYDDVPLSNSTELLVIGDAVIENIFGANPCELNRYINFLHEIILF